MFTDPVGAFSTGVTYAYTPQGISMGTGELYLYINSNLTVPTGVDNSVRNHPYRFYRRVV